jgi:hypothetical protein
LGQGVVSGEQFDQNRQYYIHKWGGDLGYEAYDHPYNDESLSAAQWKLSN